MYGKKMLNISIGHVEKLHIFEINWIAIETVDSTNVLFIA